MAYLVGQKWQIVIAKEIRDILGIKPGWIAVQNLVGNRMEIQFFPAEHRQSLMGSLANYAQGKIPPGDPWEQSCQDAWEQAAMNKDQPGETDR